MSGSQRAEHWALEPESVFLNHGSFGACPKVILDAQTEWRRRLERQPVRFFVRELEGQLDRSRRVLAEFVGAEPEGLVFVTNATTGVNAVIASLELGPGDEVLTTSHDYGACRNALANVAGHRGTELVVADVPFPIDGPDVVVERVLDAVTPRTRLVMLDHVTSPTGLVYPVEELCRELADRGIETLIDGAHAPGMLPLDLESLGATYYTGNCHKWLCTPKGSAFLYVARERRDAIHPVVTSHGWSFPATRRSRLHLEFDWPGTHDPTALLVIPDAIEFMRDLFEGGWSELRQHNRDLVIRARRLLLALLEIDEPCPESMLASLATVPFPDGDGVPPSSPLYSDPLQDVLLEEHGIEVPIMPWPAAPKRLLRISAQAYNSLEQYETLVRALGGLLDF